jgi:hypothetical protein
MRAKRKADETVHRIPLSCCQGAVKRDILRSSLVREDGNFVKAFCSAGILAFFVVILANARTHPAAFSVIRSVCYDEASFYDFSFQNQIQCFLGCSSRSYGCRVSKRRQNVGGSSGSSGFGSCGFRSDFV